MYYCTKYYSPNLINDLMDKFWKPKKVTPTFPTFFVHEQNQAEPNPSILSYFFKIYWSIKWENMNFPQLFCRWADPADFPPALIAYSGWGYCNKNSIFWHFTTSESQHVNHVTSMIYATKRPLGTLEKLFRVNFRWVWSKKMTYVICHKFWKTTMTLSGLW